MALPLYLSHPACLEHETGAGHPERPARITAVERSLAERDWQDAQRHADAMMRARDSASARVVELERAQDELLGKLVV